MSITMPMQDLIVDLARRIEKLEKTMMNFFEVMKTMEVTTKSTDGTGVSA